MGRPLLSLSVLLLLVLSAYAHGGHHHHDDNSGVSSDEPPAKPELRSKTLIFVKIFCLILEFVVTFVAGISPYFMKWNQGFLVLGTQFAGGVFLGTALMHFLSESDGTVKDLAPTKDYPFAFMLCCLGYLLTMLADCVISHVFAKQGSSSRGYVYQFYFMGDSVSKKQLQWRGLTVSGNKGKQKVDEAGVAQSAKGPPPPAAVVASSIGDSVLLIVALCFHSVFEGIAIGVAETTGEAWRALWTISLHKVFAAIAMGIALLQMIPNRPILSCAAYTLAFAISTPIGVVIGIVIDSTTQGVVADWIYAISMGFACGVFIYVSINHLLSKGYSPPTPDPVDTPHIKFLAVLLGVAVIAVVMIWD
ncbi:zinc transporter 11-like [Telopea speciosissima]|uniref:zinc transporter 11-like n=1 Tax=Telopea speciosissima TaxID=54955 RepID=UPI001CC51EB0|nr:zinc transporter 11-like [Telopea speciosissima]